MDKKVNELLKYKRQQNRFSLQAVHQETRISMIYLEALEAGRWEVFPAEVYLIGFLRKYASYLGLDAEEMARLYKSELAVVREKVVEDAKKEAVYKQVEESQSLYRGVVLSLFIMVFAGWWVYAVFLTDRGDTYQHAVLKAKKKLDRSVVLQGRLFNLEIKSVKKVWLRIERDKNLTYEGYLMPGVPRALKAEEYIKIKADRPDEIQLVLNARKINSKITLQESGDFYIDHHTFNNPALFIDHE